MSDPGLLAVRHPDLGPFTATPVPDTGSLPCVQTVWLEGTVAMAGTGGYVEIDLSSFSTIEAIGDSLFGVSGRVSTLIDSYVSHIVYVAFPASGAGGVRYSDLRTNLYASEESADIANVTLGPRYLSPSGNEFVLEVQTDTAQDVYMLIGVSGWPQSICTSVCGCLVADIDALGIDYAFNSWSDALVPPYIYLVDNDYAEIGRYDYPSFSNRSHIYTHSRGPHHDLSSVIADDAGNLYVIEFGQSNAIPPIPDRIIKIHADGSTGVLYTADPPGEEFLGTMRWHAPSGPIFAVVDGGSGSAQWTALVSIDPASGARTDLWTQGPATPSGFWLVSDVSLTITPDAVWGYAFNFSTAPRSGAIFRYELASGSINFAAYDRLGDMVGLGDNTVLASFFNRGHTDASASTIVKIGPNLSFTEFCNDNAQFVDAGPNAIAPGWEYVTIGDGFTVYRWPC